MRNAARVFGKEQGARDSIELMIVSWHAGCPATPETVIERANSDRDFDLLLACAWNEDAAIRVLFRCPTACDRSFGPAQLEV